MSVIKETWWWWRKVLLLLVMIFTLFFLSRFSLYFFSLPGEVKLLRHLPPSPPPFPPSLPLLHNRPPNYFVTVVTSPFARRVTFTTCIIKSHTASQSRRSIVIGVCAVVHNHHHPRTTSTVVWRAGLLINLSCVRVSSDRSHHFNGEWRERERDFCHRASFEPFACHPLLLLLNFSRVLMTKIVFKESLWDCVCAVFSPLDRMWLVYTCHR